MFYLFRFYEWKVENKMNYRCTIENEEGKQIANIQFTLGSDKDIVMTDTIAIKVMDQFLNIVASSNFIKSSDCNTNLYREEWVDGI